MCRPRGWAMAWSFKYICSCNLPRDEHSSWERLRSTGCTSKSLVIGIHKCTFFWNSLFWGSTSCERSFLCFSYRSLEMLLCELFLSLNFWRLYHAFMGDTSVDGWTCCWVSGASQWEGILITLGSTGHVHYGWGRWTMTFAGRALKALDRVCS